MLYSTPSQGSVHRSGELQGFGAFNLVRNLLNGVVEVGNVDLPVEAVGHLGGADRLEGGAEGLLDGVALAGDVQRRAEDDVAVTLSVCCTVASRAEYRALPLSSSPERRPLTAIALGAQSIWSSPSLRTASAETTVGSTETLSCPCLTPSALVEVACQMPVRVVPAAPGCARSRKEGSRTESRGRRLIGRK